MVSASLWAPSRVDTSLALALEPLWLPRTILRVLVHPRTAFGHCCANLQ